jgi:hypothetical protein
MNTRMQPIRPRGYVLIESFRLDGSVPTCACALAPDAAKALDLPLACEPYSILKAIVDWHRRATHREIPVDPQDSLASTIGATPVLDRSARFSTPMHRTCPGASSPRPGALRKCYALRLNSAARAPIRGCGAAYVLKHRAAHAHGA